MVKIMNFVIQNTYAVNLILSTYINHPSRKFNHRFLIKCKKKLMKEIANLLF